MTRRSVASAIGEFLAEARRANLTHVSEEAERLVLDFVGGALAGSRLPGAQLLRAALTELGDGTVVVIGASSRASIEYAAFLNAHAANLLDAEDTHLPTMLHLEGVITAAVFALAGTRRIEGATAARAIVAGYDTGVALADMTHYEAGWHTSATVGSIAAAAAASVAIGLDADRAAHALSLAASFAAGLQGQFGTSAKAIQVGRASSSGLLAATLAERGVEGSLGVFDGETGWLQIHDVIRPFSPPSFGDGIRQASFKPYASAVVTHTVIEAVLSLPKEVSVGDVATVTVTVSPFARRLAWVDQPTNGIAAKMSLTHAAAVALLDRRIEPAQFDDDRVLARDAEELRNRVRVGIDPALPQFGARVEISLWNGRVLSRVIEAPLGSVSRPMTRDELVEKYRLFASSTLSSKAMLQVEDLALSLCVLPDISRLIERLALDGATVSP